MWGFTVWHLIRSQPCQSPDKQRQHVFDLAPSEGAHLNILKTAMKTIFHLDTGSILIQLQISPFTSPSKQHRAVQRHLFLHLLLSAPCQKRQMMWILPFKNAAAHFGSFCGRNSTVQYLGLGFDSMEEEPLSHCRVKLERALGSLWCALLMRPIKSSGSSSQGKVGWCLIVSPQAYISPFNSELGRSFWAAPGEVSLAPPRGTQQQLAILWSLN